MFINDVEWLKSYYIYLNNDNDSGIEHIIFINKKVDKVEL